MTTITIEMPLELKKTHFANPLEAGYFLIGVGMKTIRTKKSDTAYDYVMSGKAFEKQQNDAVLLDKKQLKAYLDNLKK